MVDGFTGSRSQGGSIGGGDSRREDLEGKWNADRPTGVDSGEGSSEYKLNDGDTVRITNVVGETRFTQLERGGFESSMVSRVMADLRRSILFRSSAPTADRYVCFVFVHSSTHTLDNCFVVD